MENLVKLKPLCIDNYDTWCQDIKVLLMDRDGWDIVKGAEILSADATPKEVRLFSSRRNKAFSTIYLNISDEYKSLLQDIEDPKVAWDKLKNQFLPDSRARVIGLMDQFFQCRKDPGEEVGLFGARLQVLVNKLNDAGKKPDVWHHAFQLIRSLPPEFSALVQSIYRWEDTKFTPDNVLTELIAEESRLKQCRKDEGFEFNLARENKSMFNCHTCHPENNSDNKYKNIKCFRCGLVGHIVSSCRVKIPQKVKVKNTDKANERKKHFKFKTSINHVVELTNNVEDINSKNAWILDTGASSHFSCNKDIFTTFEKVSNRKMSVAVDGLSFPIEGKGEVQLIVNNRKIVLSNVLYSPKLRRNLISGRQLDLTGRTFKGGNGKIIVRSKEGKVEFIAKLKQGLYFVFPNYSQLIRQEAHVAEKLDLNDWHRKFAHINVKQIVNTSKKNCVTGMPVLKYDNIACEECKIAKSRRVSHKPLVGIRSREPLELLHTDLCGPLPSPSREGHKYFLTITDDFSRKVTVFPLKSKVEVFETFRKFQVRAERFLNRKVISVRSDNGLEYCSSQFQKYLEDQGINHELTNVYTPQQNGVSERFNYSAMDAVKTLLKDSGLGNGFWSEALLHYTYTRNRICREGQSKTPFELYAGRKPSVKHLVPFGTITYICIPKQLRSKLQMRAKKGILVGYAMKTRGYRVWIPEDRKLIETINVRFGGKSASGSVLEPKCTKYSAKETEAKEVILKNNPESDSDTEDECLMKEEFKETDQEDSQAEKSESESEIQTEDDSYSDGPPKKSITWIRKAVPRKDGSRVDVYYTVKGTRSRLRSNYDVEKYCRTHGIKYNKSDFIFSGKNTYSGEVKLNDQTSHTSA